MNIDNYCAAKRLLEEKEKLEVDCKLINSLFAQFDARSFKFYNNYIDTYKELHLTRDELKYILQNRKDEIAKLESEFEKL